MPAAALLPVATELIGGILSSVQGARQEREAKRLEAESKRFKPPSEDIEERGFLNELNRKRRAIATGTAYQNTATNIGQQLANTNQGILRASGGAGGAAISGMTRAGRAAGQSLGDITAQGQQLEMGYTGMAGQLLQRIASRKAELQLNDYQRLLGQSEQSRAAGQYNKNAGTSAIIGAGVSGLNYGLNNLPARTTRGGEDIPLVTPLPTPQFPIDEEEPELYQNPSF